ncbi:MAG: hypothetical protein EZS28_001738 [Streblomastix strix]|uniref:TmcB/TmcC TPR repeats domain-containing protein n=1 Tax=Streblomastix strix TaxID=222440 RepID=A0A5J4X879_9EUKA|nr:MAG: hypothetical protein EZS28_001738 [Streblomastix strix]
MSGQVEIRVSNIPLSGEVGSYILNFLQFSQFTFTWRTVTFTIVAVVIVTTILAIRLIALLVIIVFSKHNNIFLRFLKDYINKLNTVFDYLLFAQFINVELGPIRGFFQNSPLYGDEMKTTRIVMVVLGSLGLVIHVSLCLLDVIFTHEKKMRKGRMFSCQNSTYTSQAYFLEVIQMVVSAVVPHYNPYIAGIVLSCVFMGGFLFQVIYIIFSPPFYLAETNALTFVDIFIGLVISFVGLLCLVIPGLPKIYWNESINPSDLLNQFTTLQMLAEDEVLPILVEKRKGKNSRDNSNMNYNNGPTLRQQQQLLTGAEHLSDLDEEDEDENDELEDDLDNDPNNIDFQQMRDSVKIARQCQAVISERYTLYELGHLIDMRMEMRKKHGSNDLMMGDDEEGFSHSSFSLTSQVANAKQSLDLAKAYIKLVWTEMCKETCDIGKAVKYVEKCIDNQKNAQELITKLLDLNPNSAQLLRIYAVMFRDIDRDDENAKILMNRASLIEEEEARDQYDDQDEDSDKHSQQQTYRGQAKQNTIKPSLSRQLINVPATSPPIQGSPPPDAQQLTNPHSSVTISQQKVTQGILSPSEESVHTQVSQTPRNFHRNLTSTQSSTQQQYQQGDQNQTLNVGSAVGPVLQGTPVHDRSGQQKIQYYSANAQRPNYKERLGSKNGSSRIYSVKNYFKQGSKYDSLGSSIFKV